MKETDMTEEVQNPILYLIRWSGAILILMVLSVTTYCSVERYFAPPSSCESEIADVISGCPKGDKLIECMEKGVELLKACGDLQAEK